MEKDRPREMAVAQMSVLQGRFDFAPALLVSLLLAAGVAPDSTHSKEPRSTAHQASGHWGRWLWMGAISSWRSLL